MQNFFSHFFKKKLDPHFLDLHYFETMDEYLPFLDKVKQERFQYELAIQKNSLHIKNKFFCAVCGRTTKMKSGWDWSYVADGKRFICWREHIVCPKCHFSNRFRACIHILNQNYGFLNKGNMYITENKTMLYHFLKQAFNPNLIGSEFLGNQCKFGETINSIMNQDLTNLTFNSNQFDGILCFDVLEHIPNYKLAISEIFRTLKDKGIFFFSVPFISHQYNINTRAIMKDDGTVEHLLPPVYHGDPINDAGILCYQEFGWQLFDIIKEIGFKNVMAIDYWSKIFGYLGVSNLIFVAQK